MNKEKLKERFYLTINAKRTEHCYERVMEYENCYSHAIADENIMAEDGNAAVICYKGLLWTLDEVGVQKTVQESNHPNGMYSVYNREYVTLRKHDVGSM